MFEDHGFIKFMVGMVVLTALALASWFFISLGRTDGRVTYCYITREYTTYEVRGHRDWRHDVVIAQATTADEADRLLRTSAICSK